VALPMDEQRILDEMERMLAADDPRLAARLAAFGQPGFGHALRTRRGRITFALMMLALAVAIATVLYMMSAFRLNAGVTGGPGGVHTHSRNSSTALRTSGPRSWRAVQTRRGPLTGPACAATTPPRACTSWVLLATKHA
jgi:hypothetical protein